MLRNTGRLKLWFRSPKTLEKIGEKLTKSGVINSYHYDYENVSEWIAAKTKNADLELNFSRNHNEFTNFEAEWIAVLFMYNKTAPNKSHIHKIGLEIMAQWVQVDLT
ncbi:MAG: hypothetical protein MRY83_06610 [Flavobacteriales bacterium]|nr:hypothetical protein [Flavobacteriales bacterium]